MKMLTRATRVLTKRTMTARSVEISYARMNLIKSTMELSAHFTPKLLVILHQMHTMRLVMFLPKKSTRDARHLLQITSVKPLKALLLMELKVILVSVAKPVTRITVTWHMKLRQSTEQPVTCVK